MKHFTRETLEVDEADDKVQLTTFKAGLRSRDLVASLVKNPLKIMAEMLLKAQKYMNVEDAVAAIRDDEKPGDKGRKDDDVEGKRWSTQIVGLLMRIDGRMTKAPGR